MAGKYPESKLKMTLLKIIRFNKLGLISEIEEYKRFYFGSKIGKAKTCMDAVAWLRIRDLANLLYKKAKQGLHIQKLFWMMKNNSVLKRKTRKITLKFLLHPNENSVS